MAQGDHLFVWRRHRGIPFQHHAIDIGDGTVVHFTDGAGGVAGPGMDANRFAIGRTPREELTPEGRGTLHTVRHEQPLPAEEVVTRAIESVGRQGYHLVFDNCEHFANWCVLGSADSRQVSTACERLAAAAIKTTTSSGLRIATRLGLRALGGSVRAANPAMLLADAAQWTTEALGHHVGLEDPQRRRHTGRAIGAGTAVCLGAVGGPPGMLLAGGVWATGEFAGEASRRVYRHLRHRRERPRITESKCTDGSHTEAETP